MIQDVSYLKGNVVLYKIKEFTQEGNLPLSQQKHKSNYTNIFIRYDTLEQLRKWDLSFYSNYQLSTSLQNNRVF